MTKNPNLEKMLWAGGGGGLIFFDKGSKSDFLCVCGGGGRLGKGGRDSGHLSKTVTAMSRFTASGSTKTDYPQL